MSAPTIPAFLVKLLNLLEDPDNNDIITWNHNGQSFHIFDQTRLAKEVLPLYFKHNNIASFIRQLNMYGFRKVMQVEHGSSIKIEQDDLQFSHPYFIKGQEHLLEHIKRKTSAVGSNNAMKLEEPKLSKGDVEKVLTDVNTIRSKQEQMNGKIGNLKRENEALWREVANMRQKHHKQQTIVNKLISFLVTVVGSRGMNSGVNMKRRLMPLMLEDTPTGQGPSRSAKAPRKYSSTYNVELPETPNSGKSHGGITIKEVGSSGSASQVNSPNETSNYNFDDVDVTDQQQFGMSSNASSILNAEDLLEDPVVIANARENIAQSIGEIDVDVDTNVLPSSQAVFPGNFADMAGSQESQVQEIKHEGERKRRGSTKLKLNIPNSSNNSINISAPSPTTIGENALDQLMTVPSLPETFTPDILDNQLDNVQFNLDSIKDLLSDGYSLDANTIYGIFTESQTPGSLPISRKKDALFDPEVPVQQIPGQLLSEDSNDGSLNDNIGKELVEYTNQTNDDIMALFDFGDVDTVDLDEENIIPNVDDNTINHELNTPIVTPYEQLKSSANLSMVGASRKGGTAATATTTVKNQMEDLD